MPSLIELIPLIGAIAIAAALGGALAGWRPQDRARVPVKARRPKR